MSEINTEERRLVFVGELYFALLTEMHEFHLDFEQCVLCCVCVVVESQRGWGVVCGAITKTQ